MRIASIVLPNADNDGASLADCHATLRALLVDSFDGYTAVASQGGWRDSSDGKLYEESGTLYTVAMDATDSNESKLLAIARMVGTMARQVCVMVTLPSGDVVFAGCESVSAEMAD